MYMHNSACKSISFLDVIIDNNAYRWFGERYTKMDDGLDIQWEHNIIITLTFLNLDFYCSSYVQRYALHCCIGTSIHLIITKAMLNLHPIKKLWNKDDDLLWRVRNQLLVTQIFGSFDSQEKSFWASEYFVHCINT